MKLANIEWNARACVALVVGDEFVDLTEHVGVGLNDVPRFLAMGADALSIAKRCSTRAPRLSGGKLRLRQPVLHPDKILGVGMNYRSFVAAADRIGVKLPRQRVWFYRPSGCITGPRDEVWLPHGATDLDYEVELTVVIGRQCRYVDASEAHKVIGGFTIANDLTLRERVIQALPFGKSFDTHTPIGPWIVTPDELRDPHRLTMRSWVNGQLRQDSTTADMIASCYELVAEMSRVCTLSPGDLILTGTPEGSGLFQVPPSALTIGDVVKMEIEGIGAIENRVVAEPQLSGGREADTQLLVSK